MIWQWITGVLGGICAELKALGIHWMVVFFILGGCATAVLVEKYLGVPLPNAKVWVTQGCNYNVPGAK